MQIAVDRDSTPLTGRQVLAERCLAEADAAFSRQDFKGACACLQKALEHTPEAVPLLVCLGNIQYQLQAYPDALQSFQSAAQLKPDDGEIALRLALAALRCQQPVLLEQSLQIALKASANSSATPNSAEADSKKIGLAGLGAGRADFSPVPGALKRLWATRRPACAVTPAVQAPPVCQSTDARISNVIVNSDATLQQFLDDGAKFFADVQPPDLAEHHLQNSRVVPSRVHILELMPKGGICAEVGTQTGRFAKLIFSVLQPSKFHIYDIDFTPFAWPHFQPLIDQRLVELHQGDSSALLATMPDRHFDFIYVDGDHSYEGVAKDLNQASRKIKDDGWIVCNDYTTYSPMEKMKYGVHRAVNELCINNGFEMIYLGLEPWGYHDVALRKRG